MAIHILPNISRSKGNQAVEFGQLIQYNMKNIFVEKSYTKCGGESIPDSFVKNENWAYLWMNSLKFKTFCFYCMPSGDYQNILILSCRPLAFTPLKSRRRSGTSLPASFVAIFLKKNISLVIFYHLINFHCLFAFTSWDIGRCVYCNCLLTRLWCHQFEINLNLSNQASFFTWPKSEDKNREILRSKRTFKMK